MNLTLLQSQLYDRLGYSSSPSADVTTRLTGYLNEAQRRLVATRGLTRLRRTVLTATCVANSPFMVMPQACVRIAGIQNRTTQRSLKELMLAEVRYLDPGLTRATSDPEAYAILNIACPVSAQPADASTVYVKSDSSADVAVAYIEGIRTGGYFRSEQVTMTGTTAVAFTTTDWIDIQKFYLASPAQGTVQLLEDSGSGNVLSTIPKGRQMARYTLLHLYGTPSSSLTFYCDVERHIEDMANAGDEPYLPEDYHWLLMTGARMMEYEKRKDWSAYGNMRTEWNNGIGELKSWVRTRTDDGKTPYPSRFSQLGPYYPAGS